ncbi:MAG: hypothetical protein K6G26_02860 [Lachnospiraceae bacterium]|nr:hypothetical protein [Lachnospiraceae bacterium]
MWKDDKDAIERIYTELKTIKKFPAACPVCNKLSVHVYMHIYDDKTRRGGLWIWCSECHSFYHSYICVPKFWRNCDLIKKEELCAIPDYLEKMSSLIDAHVNTVINKTDCTF